MPISEAYNEDCMIGMARYPDKFFDLAIVDPPYGINAPNMQMGSTSKARIKGGVRFAPNLSTAQKLKGRLNQGCGTLKNRSLNTMNCNWDYAKPSPEYFKELFRVSKHQIIWGGNYFDLPPTRGIICWDKLQPWDNFSQWEMAWTSFDKPAAIFRYSNTGGANAEGKIHPTQKPVKLYSWCIVKFGFSVFAGGGSILDTHMGSQSSRIAAYQMGFDYYGWEIDKEYFEDGNKRFKEQTAQLKLL